MPPSPTMYQEDVVFFLCFGIFFRALMRSAEGGGRGCVVAVFIVCVFVYPSAGLSYKKKEKGK